MTGRRDAPSVPASRAGVTLAGRRSCSRPVDDAELVHFFHCCPDTALCGADLSGESIYAFGPDDPLCVVCDELFGADCSVTCRLVVFT